MKKLVILFLLFPMALRINVASGLALCKPAECIEGHSDMIYADERNPKKGCYYCNDSDGGQNQCDDYDTVIVKDKNGDNVTYTCKTNLFNDKWERVHGNVEDEIALRTKKDAKLNKEARLKKEANDIFIKALISQQDNLKAENQKLKNNLAEANKKSSASESCFRTGAGTDADFTVLFENGKDTISDQNCLNELRKQLNSIAVDNCQRILLFGSADSIGTNNYANGDLSRRRTEYVKGLFDGKYDIVSRIGGDVHDIDFIGNNGTIPNPEERAVRIYIGYKNSCHVPGAPTITQQKCNQIPDTQWNPISGECECINAGYTLVNGKCVKGDSSSSTTISSEQSALTRIRNAVSSADGIKSSLEADKTVWRNEDGKFNTTRLASDSIAAVVLGTAGGLITSNVIRKNQVENGFEDISCTIGGQVVAGWGDEFSVGVR